LSRGAWSRRRRTSKSEIPTRKNPKLKSGEADSRDAENTRLASATARE
jgi:hypothetical protein